MKRRECKVRRNLRVMNEPEVLELRTYSSICCFGWGLWQDALKLSFMGRCEYYFTAER